MKFSGLLATAVTALIATSFAGSGYASDDTQSFTVTGSRISVGLDLKVVESSSPDQMTEEGDMRAMGPSVLITRGDVDREGRPVSVEVAAGIFVDGEVTLEGTIEDRTKVLISVIGIGEKSLSLSAVAVPGEDLSFAIWTTSLRGVQTDWH